MACSWHTLSSSNIDWLRRFISQRQLVDEGDMERLCWQLGRSQRDQIASLADILLGRTDAEQRASECIPTTLACSPTNYVTWHAKRCTLSPYFLLSLRLKSLAISSAPLRTPLASPPTNKDIMPLRFFLIKMPLSFLILHIL